MSLLARIHADRESDLRMQAALHGRELVTDASPVSAQMGGLRGFHERMKKRLGR